jgi:hypothetical protein
MNRIQRCLTLLAGPGATLIVLAAAAPAAFAYRAAPGPAASSRPLPPDAWPQPPGWFRHPHLPPGHIHQPVHLPQASVPVHAVVIGGMPGWQITLIAATAALLAAALAVLLDRAWAARRHVTTSAM